MVYLPSNDVSIQPLDEGPLRPVTRGAPERIVSTVGKNPIEHESLGGSHIEDAIIVTEKAVKAIKPERNPRWKKLSRCAGLHRIYDRAN